MTDIVARLRERADDKFIRDAALMGSAADEIEHLRSRLAVLEGALLKLRELMDE